MKRTALGYMAFPTALLLYAYIFYKLGVEPRAGKPISLAYVKFFGISIVAPGLMIFLAVRNLPILSLSYLSVVLGWAAVTTIFMRGYVDYGHGPDSAFVALALGFLITWPPFLLTGLFVLMLFLERLLGKLETRCASRRAD